MNRLAWDGDAEPVSRDQILRHARELGNINFLNSADHEQDWQPYTVDPYSCYMCNNIYIYIYIYICIPVQLTTSRVGDLTWLIHTLAICIYICVYGHHI